MSGAEERLADDPTSELWGEHRSRYRFAATQFNPGQRVLDVACGSGFGLRMLSDAGLQPIGIDYDGATLHSIHASAKQLVHADATCLPLRTASVDHVVSFETIEHVPDARALVHELRRVLKPDGRLVLSTPNRLLSRGTNPFHLREFSADELRALLLECFSSVAVYGQRPSGAYRYVPFLMTERSYAPSALAWKALVRLPFGVKQRVALSLSGKPFYPGEADYCFDADHVDEAHALMVVAQ